MVGWLVGWLVGCKNRANYLHFYNYLPCLRTFPFQNLRIYHTAIRNHCKVRFLDLMGKFLGVVIFTFACRNLSESVGIFSIVNSSICIAYISILCYYYLTDSVCMPWQVRYFFKVRVCCRASITLGKEFVCSKKNIMSRRSSLIPHRFCDRSRTTSFL